MRVTTHSAVGSGLIVVAFGVAITAFVNSRAVRPLEMTATPQPAPTVPSAAAVTVAAKDIKRGDRLTLDMLSSLQLAQKRPVGALDRPADVVGAVAIEDIKAGQILLNSSISHDKNVRPGLSALVPAGMRAMALRVNDESAVGDFLRPDDTVDIELVLPADKLAKIRGENVSTAGRPETQTLLQDIKVLTVGETLTVTQNDKAVRMQNLTVAVTPKQALLLGLGTQVGSFYLALRHPSDTAESSVQPAGVDDILHESTPAAKSAVATSSPRRHNTPQITIIEGTREVQEDAPR